MFWGPFHNIVVFGFNSSEYDNPMHLPVKYRGTHLWPLKIVKSKKWNRSNTYLEDLDRTKFGHSCYLNVKDKKYVTCFGL